MSSIRLYNVRYISRLIISSDRLFATVRELDPCGVERRLHDLQRHRGEYVVPGPNFLWSIDGHEKLSFWGIEIYGAVDAYSRYVVWAYVGISNRTGVSVYYQYLDTIRSVGVQPRHLRSDRGTETTLVASGHHELIREQFPNTELNQCYWYGTSTANQRIESWL